MQTGLPSPESTKLLRELQRLSVEMIDTNPFAEVNKTGTLEKIKNLMRQHVPNPENSAKQSFVTFWSQGHLSQAGWSKEIEFYNREIQPRIAANYFRHSGEHDDFADEFWRIDIWFNILFGLEFLVRTYYIHRRHKGLTWLEAMLWRWYEIFLFLPFSFLHLPFFGLLRGLPVSIRLYQAELLNLNPVRDQIKHGFVASFAEELTEAVVLQIINQVQSAVRQGEITRWLSSQQETRAYVDINNVNEVEAIAKLVLNITVRQVIPKIQPDIEAILRHNIDKILTQSPVYRGLQNIPGMSHIPNQMTEKLVAELSQSVYNTLVAAIEAEDPVSDQLNSRLMENLSQSLSSEFQRQQTMQKLQSLVSDLLEELKINYVKRLSEQDVEEFQEQTRQIRELPENNSPAK